MKKFLISLVMLLNLSVAGLFAQKSLVATLSHGDNISMYYGVNALVQALEAAVSGDVISLSGGTFNPVNIGKAVSIRGTGIDESLPTIISGDFEVKLPENETNRLHLEGVSCAGRIHFRASNGCASYITKCRLAAVIFEGTSISASLTNCLIDYVYENHGSKGNCNAQFFNCFVHHQNLYASSAYSWMNCIIDVSVKQNMGYWSSTPSICNSQLLNCIIYATNNEYLQLASDCIITNSVAVNMNDLFKNQIVNTGNYHSSFEELFKNFTGGNFENQKFELTDEAKAKFLGTDSTEVGWYGGVLPYTSVPSYPRITKMDVANKSTADGKLSVEIEVSAAK